MSLSFSQNEAVENLLEFQGGSNNYIDITVQDFETSVDSGLSFNTTIILVANLLGEYPDKTAYPIPLQIDITLSMDRNDENILTQVSSGRGFLRLAPGNKLN